MKRLLLTISIAFLFSICFKEDNSSYSSKNSCTQIVKLIKAKEGALDSSMVLRVLQLDQCMFKSMVYTIGYANNIVAGEFTFEISFI